MGGRCWVSWQPSRSTLPLRNQSRRKLTLRAEAEEAKAEALLEDAQELLKTGEGVEVVRVIEHDLDGIDGPETLQVVRTRIVEDDSMTVVHTVEQISSALDGDIMQQTVETLDVNTARWTQRACRRARRIWPAGLSPRRKAWRWIAKARTC